MTITSIQDFNRHKPHPSLNTAKTKRFDQPADTNSAAKMRTIDNQRVHIGVSARFQNTTLCPNDITATICAALHTPNHP